MAGVVTPLGDVRDGLSVCARARAQVAPATQMEMQRPDRVERVARRQPAPPPMPAPAVPSSLPAKGSGGRGGGEEAPGARRAAAADTRVESFSG